MHVAAPLPSAADPDADDIEMYKKPRTRAIDSLGRSSNERRRACRKLEVCGGACAAVGGKELQTLVPGHARKGRKGPKPGRTQDKRYKPLAEPDQRSAEELNHLELD